MASPADLAADMADLEVLLANATRPNVRAMITDYLQQLRDEYITQTSPAKRPASTTVPTTTAPVPAPALCPPTVALPPAAPPCMAPPPAVLPPAAPPPAASPPAAPAAPPPATPLPAAPQDVVKALEPIAKAPPPAPPPTIPTPVRLPTKEPSAAPDITYTTIASFGWDQDSYGTDPNHVYVYVMSGVDGVGEVKDRVSCDFTKSSFDLRIVDLGGKNLRLLKNNLDKEIDPAASKCIVKKNKVTIKLRKIKGTYGYDQWIDLTAKKPKFDANGKEKDPGDALMDMMKQMYDDGDDNMKKTLGEAMLKSRQREGNPGMPMDDADSP